MDTQKTEYIEWADWLWYMLVKKQLGLKRHGQKIVNLCLRGSYCYYAFNPECFDDFTYNAGANNQDLFCAYFLLKNYLSYLPNCKNIILSYGFFLNGYDLSKTKERWRCYYYKRIFGIPYDIEASNIEDFPKEIAFNVDLSDYQGYTESYAGYKEPDFKDRLIVKERVQKHLKNFHRNKRGLVYLKKIYKLCKQNNIKLHIIIQPVRPDYKYFLPKYELEKSVSLLKKIVPSKYIHNFFYDLDFNYKDFLDTEHMNIDGATKLSYKINDILQKQKKYEVFKKILNPFLSKMNFSSNKVSYYDTIISLGGNCAAAMQLDFRGLRKYSLPFDYLFMKDEQTIKYLLNGFKNNFNDFFLRENMVELVGDERGDDRHGCVQYKDILSGYRAIHAFKEHVENNIEHYNEIMTMFRRRFDRMFEKIENSNRVALVLATPFSFDLKLLKPLQKYLHKKYPHKIIDWYIVQFGCKKNDAKMFKLKTGVMYFYSYIRENNFDDFAKKDLPEWSFMDNFIIK